MARLYELTGELGRICELAIDPETGEVDDAFSKALASLEGAIERKIEGVCMILRNLETEADSLKDEEARLAKRRKSMEANVMRLRAYVRECMEVGDIPGVKTSRFTVSLSKNPVKKLQLVGVVPAEYLRAPKPREPDKAAITKALKGGAQLEWAKLVDGERTLTIR